MVLKLMQLAQKGNPLGPPGLGRTWNSASRASLLVRHPAEHLMAIEYRLFCLSPRELRAGHATYRDARLRATPAPFQCNAAVRS